MKDIVDAMVPFVGDVVLPALIIGCIILLLLGVIALGADIVTGILRWLR